MANAVKTVPLVHDHGKKYGLNKRKSEVEANIVCEKIKKRKKKTIYGLLFTFSVFRRKTLKEGILSMI